MITISIITITYNDLTGLKNTINSIDNHFKSYNSYIDHVIIDGNSTDGTIDFLKIIKNNRYIHTTIISESDLGIYDAMNKGVLNSTSDFVIFINSGDILLESFFKINLYDHLNNIINMTNSAGLAFSCVYNFNGKKIRVLSRDVNLSMPRMPSLHQAIVYKRSILLEIPYHLNFKICGDFENICRIIKKYKFHTSKVVISELIAGGVSTLKPYSLARESYSIYKNNFAPNSLKKFIYILKISCSLLVVQILFITYNNKLTS